MIRSYDDRHRGVAEILNALDSDERWRGLMDVNRSLNLPRRSQPYSLPERYVARLNLNLEINCLQELSTALATPVQLT